VLVRMKLDSSIAQDSYIGQELVGPRESSTL